MAAQVGSAATAVAASANLPIVVAGPVVSKPAAVALPPIAGTPRQMAYAVAVRAGLNAQQWSCLSSLWQQESKFQTTARNSRSGAYGIPQALPASRMATAGADWRTNPVTQIRWGLSYIRTRYGTACTAWSHWERDRWY
jgi:Transglycosylase SLT domain